MIMHTTLQMIIIILPFVDRGQCQSMAMYVYLLQELSPQYYLTAIHNVLICNPKK